MTRDSKPSVTSSRLWHSPALSAAALSLAAGPAAAVTPAVPQSLDATHLLIWQAEAESTEAGQEGTTAQADEAGAVAPEDEEIATLAALGHFEGHLRVANDLYGVGDLGEAVTHMKRPDDEMYTELEARLQAQGKTGFAEELTAMAAAIDGEAPVAEAEAAFDAVRARIIETREALAGDNPVDRLAALPELLRSAAKEYEEGLTNAQPGDLHPYHKARGYVAVVQAEAEALAQSTDTTVAGAADEVLAALAETKTAFPGLLPEGDLPVNGAELLQGALGRVESAAHSLQ